MKLNAAFTICAKNYLAQALTLKHSFKKANPAIDFFIFLSDLADVEELSSLDLTLLDESWIPEWERMAFKYNVIEFSTSIKPFCYNKLFKEGYEKVIYLDPDIYVLDSLKTVLDYLDKKTIVLSPHYCNLQTNYTGAVPEEELLFVGIYNLGFVAIKKNLIGIKIVEWWMNRLTNKCYADKFDALHVDQKWMDFIPAFFPDETFITHHMGINPAIWNLHERELQIDENGFYKIKNLLTKEVFPLLFFHFSGFDPFNPALVNRRHPNYNTTTFPSFTPLFKEYIESEYDNRYDFYSKLKYSFNAFEDGENILRIHRRLFRINESNIEDKNPFANTSSFRLLLKQNHLLTGIKSNDFSTYTSSQKTKKIFFENVVLSSLKLIKRIFGIQYYSTLILFLHDNTRFEMQNLLLNKNGKYK